MRTLTMAVAVLASVTLVAEAGAQKVPTPTGQSSPPLGEQTPAQEGDEKTVEGQVGELFKDGDNPYGQHQAGDPPGVVMRPGVLTEGHDRHRELQGAERQEGHDWNRYKRQGAQRLTKAELRSRESYADNASAAWWRVFVTVFA